jgi:hypothetical protein
MYSFRVKPESLAKAILLAGSLLYLGLLPRLDVGCFNDDAVYVQGAQSLLQGSYLLRQLPQPVPMNHYMPGWPLMLAPFVAPFQPHWAWLKLIPLFLTILSGILLWQGLQPWLVPWARLVVLTLYLFNPTIAQFSGSLMTEPLFLTLTIGSLITLGRLLQRPFPTTRWLLSGLLAWASLVRPEGILLALAVFLGLAWARRWRTACQVFGIALLVWGAWHARNFALTGSFSNYAGEWRARLLAVSSQNQGEQSFLQGWAQTGQMFWGANVFGLDEMTIIRQRWLGALAMIAAGGLSLAGLARLAQRKNRIEEASLLAGATFCLFYVLVHALWLLIDLRFLLPVIPFALIGLTAACAAFVQRWPRTRPAVLAGAVGLFVSYAYQDAAIAHDVTHPVMLNRVPRETLAWVQTHLAPESFVFSPIAPVIFLYTGRSAASYASPADPRDREEFRYWLFKNHMTHVLYRPFMHLGYPPLPNNRQTLWEKSEKWAASRPAAFPLLYHNPAEHTDVYAVPNDSAFQEAYTLFQAAREDCEQGRFSECVSKLQLSLKRYPTVGALNAYAATCLVTGRHLEQAEAKLQEALRIEPDHPLALLNLSRVYAATGRPAQARATFRKAAAAAAVSDEYERFFRANFGRQSQR